MQEERVQRGPEVTPIPRSRKHPTLPGHRHSAQRGPVSFPARRVVLDAGTAGLQEGPVQSWSLATVPRPCSELEPPATGSGFPEPEAVFMCGEGLGVAWAFLGAAARCAVGPHLGAKADAGLAPLCPLQGARKQAFPRLWGQPAGLGLGT